MARWSDKAQVKKGVVGERIVKRWLEKNGWIIYRPETDGAHPFDNLCATRDKQTLMIAEVKTKPARTYHPDTGINETALTDYLKIQKKHNLKVFLFFVDEKARKIYGEELDKLNDEWFVTRPFLARYPRRERNGGIDIVYFPLERMRIIADLTDTEAMEISNWSTRNPAYD